MGEGSDATPRASNPVLDHAAIWRRYDAVEARLTAAVSERMLDLAALAPGMRVLDLATGRGEPALRAARRVGPDGLVLGLELSEGLLEIARETAERYGLRNLDLRAADAAAALDLPPAHFHAATCRWGLMYMDEPVAALSQVRRALRSDGVCVAAFWAEPERVPYSALPRRLIEPFRALPPIDFEAPGTFRYADLERIERDFEAAGLAVDHVEEIETAVFEDESVAEVVAWVETLGQSALGLAELSETDRAAWKGALAHELEGLRRGDTVRLGGVTRIVRGRSV